MELSKKRENAAKKLETAIEREINLLEMGGTKFKVSFTKEGPGEEKDSENLMNKIRSDGYDRVEFMISPNIGEDLRSLSRIASGGELSRIMLALKTILAKRASVETIIFDEVVLGEPVITFSLEPKSKDDEERVSNALHRLTEEGDRNRLMMRCARS